MTNIASMTLVQLKQIAKENGLKGISGYKKAELVKAIEELDKSESTQEKEVVVESLQSDKAEISKKQYDRAPGEGI